MISIYRASKKLHLCSPMQVSYVSSFPCISLNMLNDFSWVNLRHGQIDLMFCFVVINIPLLYICLLLINDINVFEKSILIYLKHIFSLRNQLMKLLLCIDVCSHDPNILSSKCTIGHLGQIVVLYCLILTPSQPHLVLSPQCQAP